jgi:hypothetical protein
MVSGFTSEVPFLSLHPLLALAFLENDATGKGSPMEM